MTALNPEKHKKCVNRSWGQKVEHFIVTSGGT